jgi:hypothetical protein
MYWNEEMRKRAVFSKLTISSCSGSIMGGMYLHASSVWRSGETSVVRTTPELERGKR